MSDQAILRRIGSFTGEQQPICPSSINLTFLSKSKKACTFGRTVASQVRLLSSKMPLMISRHHASITYEREKWMIVDHNSLNGVFLNGQKLPVNIPQEIKPGDRICFGVAIENNVHEFEYIFEMEPSACVKKRRQVFGGAQEKEPKIRKVLIENDDGNSENMPGPSGENIKDKSQTMACKIQESEKKIEVLNVLLAEKEKAYKIQLEQKDKQLAEQLLHQKNTLEEEKKGQEKYLMELLQEKLRDKERDLKNQLEQQKAILLSEKNAIENNLMEEMNRKIEEKDKELTTQLEAQRQRLESLLFNKTTQQMRLEEELSRNKVDQEKLEGLQANEKKLEENLETLRQQLIEKQNQLAKQEDITRKAEEMAKKVLVEKMEDEFTCIICQELFIEATTLPCSHSFCDYCLKSWLRKKKTCPICRTDIKGTSVRSIVLDSAVEKIVNTMDQETKTRRRTVIEERKNKNIPVIDITIEDSPPGAVPVIGNQRIPPMFMPRPPGVSARRRAQGNPGSCFNCGMRGHWARACPFRQ